MAMGKRLTFGQYLERVRACRGNHIVPLESSFTNLYQGAAVKAECTIHNTKFECLAVALTNDHYAMPCVWCYEEIQKASTYRQTLDDFDRIIAEIKAHYAGKPYDYSKSEESYFKSGGSWKDARRITVTCTLHDLDFNKSRADHLVGEAGCPQCANTESYGRHKMAYVSLDQLRMEIERVNTLGLDLSRLELKTVRNSKQWVKCKHDKGDDFHETWTVTLLRGGGCLRCAQSRRHKLKKAGTYSKLTSANARWTEEQSKEVRSVIDKINKEEDEE